MIGGTKKVKTETIVLNPERNVTLTAYIQEVENEFANISKRPAVLVIPGGGYQFCSHREGEPVALEYLKAGYQAFILKYSVGSHALWPNPLEDYEQAMALIRDRADQWALYPDKVAVIGFSAGGHLAACAATMSKNRPNGAILGYPVITGENARRWEKTAPDVIPFVDARTCPCFVFAARTDTVVPVDNTIALITALERYDISFESHIYAYGPHGFSTATDAVLTPETKLCSRAGKWVKDSIEWLKDIFGTFGDGQLTQPSCGGHINGNYEPYLSTDCTVSFLLANEQSHDLAGQFISRALGQFSQMRGDGQAPDMELVKKIMAYTPFKDFLAFIGVSKADTEKINRQLHTIRNL